MLTIINGATEYFLDDENSVLCSKNLSDSVLKLERAIDLFKRNRCPSQNTSKSRNCIPENLAEEYLPRLEALYTDLKNSTSADQNEDGILDICGS